MAVTGVQCEEVPPPTLLDISKQELEVLPSGVYWRLEENEARLIDWGVETSARLRAVCESSH